MDKITVDFYLGANAQDGFASFFTELENPFNDYTSYVIKGGPGTGKSSLMKKIAKNFKSEEVTELIHCSSDPDSLDGVFLHSSKLTFCDGTPPHTIEPNYPGAFERVINLLDAFDNEALKKEKLDIVKYSLMISSYHKKFCNFLKCANILKNENTQILKPYVDFEKLNKNINSIFKREFKNNRKKFGTAKKRLISAFSPKGLLTYTNTIDSFCENVYIVEDRYDLISDEFMQKLSQKILSAGYNIYLCYSPLDAHNKISHIIIPELKLGFISQNKYVEVMPTSCKIKTINFTRYVDTTQIKNNKEFLAFNEKCCKSVIGQMLDCMKTAKDLHDILESYYVPNVDFDVVNRKAEELLIELNKR